GEEVLAPLAERSVLALAVLDVPVPVRADRLAVVDQIVRGRQLHDIAPDRLRPWNIEIRQVALHTGLVQHVRKAGHAVEGPELGREVEPPVEPTVVEWLDAETVAGDEQAATPLVPQRVGEHAA